MVKHCLSISCDFNDIIFIDLFNRINIFMNNMCNVCVKNCQSHKNIIFSFVLEGDSSRLVEYIKYARIIFT